MSRSASLSINRRQSLLQLGALVTLPWAASAALAQQSFSVQQANGAVQVPIKPQTILVFDLAALDCLRALGAEVAIEPRVAGEIEDADAGERASGRGLGSAHPRIPGRSSAFSRAQSRAIS